jgi:hypothetical protein
MKKMYLRRVLASMIFPILLLSSCKKNNAGNNTTPPTLPSATFSFKCNGVSYQWDGDIPLASTNTKGSKIAQVSFGTNVARILCLTGSNGLDPSDPNYFTFSLPVINYDLGVPHSTPNLDATGTLGTMPYAHLSNVAENFHITFSFVNPYYANGSFDAILSPQDGSLPTLNITDGLFTYVKRLN